MYNSPIGILYIKTENDFVTEITSTPIAYEMNKLTEKVIEQLKKYFANDLTSFDLPIKLNGTNFQIKVWEELIKIPYGQTKSYKQIAESISPKACRAVGNACNKNPLLIVVPCHRVIGSNKKLTGFGIGLDKKEILLNIEK